MYSRQPRRKKIIGSIGAHEAEHTTPENLKEAHLESRGILFEGTKEVNPNKKGKQVIKELKKNE